MTFRILVTGSRSWPAPLIVEEAFHDLAKWYPIDWDDVVIVHGACPTGADKYADNFAFELDLVVEQYPADWEKYGKAAGPRRNQEMIDTKPDIVLSFMQPGSRGTLHCTNAAIKAGLPVIVYYLDTDDSETTLRKIKHNGAKTGNALAVQDFYQYEGSTAPTK